MDRLGPSMAIPAMLLMAASSPAVADDRSPQSAANLGLLTGEWIMEENGRITRETWGEPNDGVIAGHSESIKGGKADFSETMRIGPDRKGRITLWVRTQGSRAETPFYLTQTGVQPYDAYQLAFENPKRDYPQLIRYFRSGDILSASIMNFGGGKSKYFRYRPANPPKPSAEKPVPDLAEVEANVTFARSCVDDTGFVVCEPPRRTRIRNLICWPMESVASYIEPYRSSPAAECVFESVTEHAMRMSEAMRALANPKSKPPPVPWRSDWARLHYLPEGDCTGERCKRSWHMPRD